MKTVVFNGRSTPSLKPDAVNVGSPLYRGAWLIANETGNAPVQLRTKVLLTDDQIERAREMLGWTWVAK